MFAARSGGAAHVFVSALEHGQFQTPVQVDTGPLMAGDSSQPVIAAGQEGQLLVAFINDATLYVTEQASAGARGRRRPRCTATR